MKKLITLNKDGHLALRNADGTETLIPPRRTPTALLLIDVSQSMSYIDALADNKFLYDPDGSNEASSIGQAKKGGAKFAYEANAKGYAVALAIFADRAAMVLDATTDAALLASKINKLRPGMLGSSTDLAAALVLANKFKDDLAAVVIVTDGQVQEDATLDAAQPLKRREVDIICIGTGAANKDFLAKLATRSGLSSHVKTGELSNAISGASKFLSGGRTTRNA